jgi:signal transduction histidine kinase
MRARAENLKGSLQIASDIEQGTNIILKFSI